MVIHKYLAELVGTFILVLLGTMSIVAAVGTGAPVLVVVPLGFGLALLAGIVSVGHLSGAHFNPAVTVAMWLDKRTNTTDLIGYLIAQFVGAIVASLVLLVMSSQGDVAGTVTGYGDTTAGLISEIALTAIFVFVILVATKKAERMAAIAISLTLAGVHFAGIPFSGSSVNPARSFGPALVGAEMTGLWVYFVGPLVGAVLAWGLWRVLGTAPEE